MKSGLSITLTESVQMSRTGLCGGLTCVAHSGARPGLQGGGSGAALLTQRQSSYLGLQS